MIPAGTRITIPRDRPEVRELLLGMKWRVTVDIYSHSSEVTVREPLSDGLDTVWNVAASLLGDGEAHRSLGSLLHVLGALDAEWRARVVDALESSARLERVAS